MAGRKTGTPKTGGRQKGTPNKATREIKEIAQAYTDTAIATLAFIAENGESEAARVSAANSILDRAYGKPRLALEHSGPDGQAIEVKGAGVSGLLAAALKDE
ncbi:hypothetical protein WSS15_03310 [Acetobacter pasteurianus]|uniref:Uncharacterized protein n=3 Tax=Acetobacter pasteurianus TaxID=438 RepID=A0A401WWM4_ACEPA|nr:hypothetical protein [Acetobacter pasteurianus]BAH98978.1 hypothetical protein APA01_08300 [Acetobacter pasteurianus IFO 3283-01]BAI02029.1 hypothetical protein APA03_08300 [Acetobacter pasteurianus IFO 3283-03]BAI05077.1 hypothetical protein APA07_08300 [Acetobacter pasteurianus IFO 3283-07]BAI08124.1 hypothetical protein APA22_08300 [Acetobacter pasteurianus IFO 3283-22]BAI11172.1 hypothetical protein APA26_08300 [Acetobacter pasteurianus IFO 3283-26]